MLLASSLLNPPSPEASVFVPKGLRRTGRGDNLGLFLVCFGFVLTGS